MSHVQNRPLKLQTTCNSYNSHYLQYYDKKIYKKRSNQNYFM